MNLSLCAYYIMRISKKVISLLFVIILAVSVSAFATVAFAVEENANSSNNAIGNYGSNISNDYSQVAGSVSLSKSQITLGVNEKYTLVANIKNTNKDNQPIIWNVTDNSIISVENGSVTANAFGTAVVSAKLQNGSTANCTIKVLNAPTNISLNKTSITLGVGETFDLNSSLPAGCGAYSIVYSTNNSAVATVKALGGLVTAKSAGTAKITATTYNGKTVTCTVNVKKAPTSVALNKTSVTLGIGEIFDLNSSLPAGCGAYSVKYSTNNSSIATVKTSGGLVTAKSTGTAKITATTY
ncbi:MAG: Ig-like domain-containing protein, partial [Acutalibacteraceae bacterium]